MALLEAGRARLGADGEAARHLRAMPGARAGLEEAVEMLERTRLLDDAERFERAWHALREGAAEIGVPELHAPGHRLVAELGRKARGRRGDRCACTARAGGMAEDRSGADGAGGRGAHPARPHRGVAGARNGGPAAGRARRARSETSRSPRLARGRRCTGGRGRGHAAPQERPRAAPGRRGRPARGYPAGGAGGPGRATRRPLPGIRVADEGGGPAGAR